MIKVPKSHYLMIIKSTDLGYLVGRVWGGATVTENFKESDLEKIGEEKMAYASSWWPEKHRQTSRTPHVFKSQLCHENWKP